MKKIKIGLLVTTIILSAIVIKMATDKYNFAEGAGIPSQYPPNEDLKNAVNQILDETLPDKIFDLTWKKMFHWITFFESIDGFALSATAPTIGSANISLTTSGASGNEVEISKPPLYQGLVTFSQRSAFRTTINLSVVTNQTVYVTVGNKDSTHYYGFKVTNATLFGVTYDGGTENAVTLATLSAATAYTLEARYNPSDKVVFLVDNIEKGASKTNLPSPVVTANAQMMDIRIKANAAEAKTLQASYFEYLQRRNILN